ncbi:hypothetical protein AC231_11225 [Clostridium pasteurianum]|uniref:stage II sporulation protein M n=1 Tax=Clostridium pasteurianum TaxID=1501 RepID=UPI0009769AAE|nr:stage II sporulation protein M [Clostridium pasteurianum]OMH21141.1 hypothetical protein AC231_11225 [Clostridium pasteurianum]
MKLENKQIKKIFIIDLSFWILPVFTTIFVLFIDINNKFSKDIIDNIAMSNFTKILINNFLVYVAIILVGLINNKLPYILFYYNSIMYSGIALIFMEHYGVVSCIIRTIPHGMTEILGLSIATYIGINIKNIQIKIKIFVFLGTILIFISALIESFVIFFLNGN